MWLVAVGFLYSPARSYLDQRGQIASAQATLDKVRAENDRLTKRADRLDDPDEIQRAARRDYGLVGEGEESYTILPPATAGLVLPRAWPFDVLSDSVAKASAAAPGG